MTALQSSFYHYQWTWLQDASPLKIGLWSRQTGKDFTCAAEAVIDCLQKPKNHWLIIACGERQALESFEKAKHWANHLSATFTCSSSRPFPFSASRHELRFKNGSRLTALPSKPETLRGYSANLILTEFAFHDRPDDIWRSVFPIITNPLRGGRKKLRIISTPNGQNNLFHKLWLNPDFAKHKVTIHEAKAAGLPLDLDLLKRGLAHPEAWSQEYECEFIDTTSVLLPYELIQTCESADATESSTPQHLSTLSRDLYVGIDFARKQDLTVCWILEKLPPSPNPQSEFRNPQFITREVLVLQNLPHPRPTRRPPPSRFPRSPRLRRLHRRGHWSWRPPRQRIRRHGRPATINRPTHQIHPQPPFPRRPYRTLPVHSCF